jgi:cytochrome b6-f complex iron-sulfur subunit
MATKKMIEPTPAGASPPRRRFLNGVWITLGLAALAELIWLVGTFLRSGGHRSMQTAPDAMVEAGPVVDFAPGSITAFPQGKFYLVRLPEGGFLALSRSCPHLGCTLPWVEDEKRFVCPCHASAFDIRGDVLRAPAPRAMALHPVTIENAVVRVDPGRIVRRSRFDTRQVVYPPTT